MQPNVIALMSNDEKMIAMAEALGFQKFHQIRNYPKSWGSGSLPYEFPSHRLTQIPLDETVGDNTDCYRRGWSDEPRASKRWREDIPNYLDSRDVMRDAWLTLNYNQQAVFGHNLCRTLFGRGIADGLLLGEHDIARLANAPAHEMAVAFLLTVNPNLKP